MNSSWNSWDACLRPYDDFPSVVGLAPRSLHPGGRFIYALFMWKVLVERLSNIEVTELHVSLAFEGYQESSER